MLPHGISCALFPESTKPCPCGMIFSKSCATISPIYVKPWERSNGEVKRYAYRSKVTAAGVRVGVRSGVVAVQVRSAVVLVLAVVAADVQNNAGGVVVAVVVMRTEIPKWNTGLLVR